MRNINNNREVKLNQFDIFTKINLKIKLNRQSKYDTLNLIIFCGRGRRNKMYNTNIQT